MNHELTDNAKKKIRKPSCFCHIFYLLCIGRNFAPLLFGPWLEGMSSPERQETHCQYFLLSPGRQEEGPDENTDVNITRTVVKIAKSKAKTKSPLLPGSKKPVTVRPSTPTRTSHVEAKTPAPMTARVARTPKTEPRAPLTARTPARTPKVRSPSHEKRLEEDDLTASVGSGHISVYSEVSGHSRLTQLSKKSFSKRILSSKELEELEVMEKRRQLSAMLRRNQMNCRKALNGTDLSSAGRKQSATKLTEPKEFHFSCPPTPRSPSPETERYDPEESKAEYFPRFLRGSSSCQSLETWKPQLTVPRGPQLRVVRRLSAPRLITCQSDDEPKTPRRHLAEVRRAAAEEERRAVKTPAAVARPRVVIQEIEKVRPEKPLIRQTTDGSPVGLLHSHSSKNINRGNIMTILAQSPRSSRVSFGSKTPRPCCPWSSTSDLRLGGCLSHAATRYF